MNSIGSTIKKHREMQGLTQFHMALELGISQSAYAQIESGATKMSIDRAIQVTKILMIDLNELIKSSSNSSTDYKPNVPIYYRVVEIEQRINSLQDDFIALKEQIDILIEKLDIH
jgi:transcriptional regulator with XRE-family HTH domain